MTHDCWNRIGVRGDRSCPELETHVHCRNCRVYADAAQLLLDRERVAAETAERTRHFAGAAETSAGQTRSLLIFRVGAEWLALPTASVTAVVTLRAIHSLPHRRGGALLGVTNVRGELLTCVSLTRLLSIPAAAPAPAAEAPRRTEHARLLLLRRDGVRAVCPVDDVHGVETVTDRDLTALPETVGRASTAHSRAVVTWRQGTAGLLDEDRLFRAIQRSIA